jgi:hypothetical protein
MTCFHQAQEWRQVGPGTADARVVDEDAVGGSAKVCVLRLHERRDDVSFFVFVMCRSGDVEVAKDISSCLLRLLVNAMVGDVALQSHEEEQGPTHAVVASREHLERLLEADCGRLEARKRFRGTHVSSAGSG